jgi:lipopolysaccharide transport system ATP-binding protein
MSNYAIRVENLSKRYRIGKAVTNAGNNRSLFKLLRSPFNYLTTTLKQASDDEILWALRDVSFEVEPGEVIGIIGKNGAGKSTLLKILSRITEPTSGRAIINGRVGSLLEVGTGFHPELTGRENIYLSGAILGMKRDEIARKFDEIVEFSETGRFLDTPVKRYSSGMYVRLAFAVAAHLEPEVLLVDEVLAVGDAAFQKKCLGKMGDVATAGRTVLFVSHNMVAIQNLCRRAVWIKDGQVQRIGETNAVVSDYLASSFVPLSEQSWIEPNLAPGNERVRLYRVAVQPVDGNVDDAITMDKPLKVEVDFWNLIPGEHLHACLHFYTEQNIVAFTTSANELDSSVSERPLPRGLIRNVCYVPKNLLNAGVHKVMLLIVRNSSKVIFKKEDILSFEIIDLSFRPGTWYGKEPGVVRPLLRWETSVIEQPEFAMK